MKIIVLDRNPIAATLWEDLAGIYEAEVMWGETYSLILNQDLPSTPCVIVVDSSVCADDFMNTIDSVIHDNPANAVVVTGWDLSTQKIVELINKGVTWLFTKELSRSEVELAMPHILQQARDGFKLLCDYQKISQLFAEVSERELSVVRLVLEGIPNKIIAKQLNVSIRTIEARRSKVYRKLHVRNVADLVRIVDRSQQLQQRFGSPIPSERIIRRHEKVLAGVKSPFALGMTTSKEPDLKLAVGT